MICIKDYKIDLKDRKNNHDINNILFHNFEGTQKTDLSKIICNNCKENNRNNIYNKEFYKCFECEMDLCPLCKSIHNKKHKIIDYNLKNFKCKNHMISFVKYCKDCKLNVCLKCEKEI